MNRVIVFLLCFLTIACQAFAQGEQSFTLTGKLARFRQYRPRDNRAGDTISYRNCDRRTLRAGFFRHRACGIAGSGVLRPARALRRPYRRPSVRHCGSYPPYGRYDCRSIREPHDIRARKTRGSPSPPDRRTPAYNAADVSRTAPRGVPR